MAMTATLAASPAAAHLRLALVGNPNTGKTTLFNALCGIRARTSNYPGTTTAVRFGSSAAGHGRGLDIVDLPGVYDLYAGVAESRIAADALTERLDRYLTHPAYGMGAFVGVMCVLFLALFTFAAVPMDIIEALFGQLGSSLTAVMPSGPVRDLLTQGIVGGLSGTVVFLPQICLLFFLITLGDCRGRTD